MNGADGSKRSLRALLDRQGLRELHPVARVLTLLLCLPIFLYRVSLSRLLPRVCRFHPSCSVYALGALQTHGPLKGSWLALRRVARCHPFHPGGFDPVPPKSSSRRGEGCDSAAPPAASSGVHGGPEGASPVEPASNRLPR